MQKLKDQLKAISQSLSTLSKQVEKITKEIDTLFPSKTAVVKKKKAPAKKPAAKKASSAKQVPVLGTVFAAIKRTRKGITVTKLKEKTNLNPRQLSNALYKLSKQGKIEAISRGLYVKKE
jgi:predicted Rossmann fold nucleotide-binding protein DprA/Smf involved in DNA uptake